MSYSIVDDPTYSRQTAYPGSSSVVSGRRYYESGMGRWINRDHIEEWGGINIYAYVDNAPVETFDVLGLQQHQWSFISSKKDISGDDYVGAQINYIDNWSCNRQGKPELQTEPSLYAVTGNFTFEKARITLKDGPNETTLRYNYSFSRGKDSFTESELNYIYTKAAIDISFDAFTKSIWVLIGKILDNAISLDDDTSIEGHPPILSNEARKLIFNMQQEYSAAGSLMLSAECYCDESVTSGNPWRISIIYPPYHHEESKAGGSWIYK